MKKLSILLISFLFCFSYAKAQNYPAPFLSEDNIYTLRTEDWLYYKNFNINITHDILIPAHSHEINGNPINNSDGIENNWGTVLINASDWNVTWKWIEAEGNITRVGSWNFVTNTSYSNNTYVSSTTIGDYIEFECFCSGFSIIWKRDIDNGYIDVYINGSLFTQINTYGSASRQSTGVYFSQTDMPVKIKLQVSNIKDSSSTGYKVEIDAVKFGSSYYRPYLLEKLKFPDNKFVRMISGTASANYLISYHYVGAGGWAVIYNQTFYIVAANPTTKPITLGIANNEGYTDYVTGSGQSTSGKIYCTLTIPPNTPFKLYVLNTSSPQCALITNSTHAGMRKTIYYPGPNSPTYTGWLTISFRIYTNDTGLLLDSFWIGLDREMPRFRIVNAKTGADLSNGGYMDCDDFRNFGLNVTISNLIPSSSGWRLRLYSSPNFFDYTANTLSGNADSNGNLTFNNVRDTGNRMCGDYDYSNIYALLLDNTAVGGTTGSTFSYLSAPIFVLPWQWAYPEVNIINLNTNQEEYILRPNQNYLIYTNITLLNGAPISTGVSISVAFVHMYGTEGLKGGYENPILLDGTTPYLLWSDRTFSLNYNSTTKRWERIFRTPAEWKYDGHVSTLRVRITNNTNTTYRVRLTTWHLPQPFQFIMFSNHYYSGSGVDVVFKDIDFGTSGNHPFYTTAGGNAPTFADNVNDVYLEDREKIILIYNSTQLSAQTPITIFYKNNGFALYTTDVAWSPAYTYLGTYRQKRFVYGESGLNKDYVVLTFRELNDLGYEYYVYFYMPANSDWFETFISFPEINSLDFIFTQTFRLRGLGNFRIFNNTIRITETFLGRDFSQYLYKTLTTSGLTLYNVYSPSIELAITPYLGFTTSLPMPTANGLNPAYPFPHEYAFIKYHGYHDFDFVIPKGTFDRYNYVYAMIWTEGKSEYRRDSLTWNILGYNIGHMLNSNFKQTRIRYVFSNTNHNFDFFLTNNYVWQYGYFTSFGKESIDIWFDKPSRSYVRENVTIFLRTRNYIQPVSENVDLYIIDQEGNVVEQIQISTNEEGKANITFSPNKTGVYIVKANNTNYKGVGFFWVLRVKIPGALFTSIPTCYDSSSVIKYYVCSSDNTSDVSVTQAMSLIYIGSPLGFVKTCFFNHSSDDYKFNITVKREPQFLLSLTKASCEDVDRKFDTIAFQGYPPAIIGINENYSYEKTKIRMSLKYDKILIQGAGKFGKGTHKICVEKIGESNNKPLIKITTC